MTWSAKQYVKFENERTRPVRDLLAAVPGREPRVAVDIGCGPGNSTEVLAACFPGASVTGLDSSADMVEAARKRLPALKFEVSRIETWYDPGPYDVILANAVLQWLPDHGRLLPALAAKLAPGGSLAIQVPDTLDTPAHRLMREVAADGPWAGKLAAASQARTGLQGAGWYYELLRAHCGAVDVWHTTYHHALAGGPAAIVEWFKGTGLRPFLDPLDEAERAAYLERYTAQVARAYPPMADGTVLLPFPRFFIVATR
ncbi:trans-aconitate 2-methyltransferase [Cupriavidus basilensis]|uniref:trans-aconitate 2-methyltransferase n=1 Tax=Cupriavidus basilensis TaxID=68895 RepID=UPI00157B3633|nr:trans-aconitate 2-methyltransferase [Cupriavidus basilensis]NUA30637.1 trans-aconitate 2-methyltransferase [Cupriavidus basilensis]